MRYDSIDYLTTFNASGVFPSIHKDVAELIKEVAVAEPVLDLGASTGLLSMQAVQLGRSKAIAIEPSSKHFIVSQHVARRTFKISLSTLQVVRSILVTHRPTLVICRRIIPEISDSGKVLPDLIKLFFDEGVTHIVGEARVFSKNTVHPLGNFESEVAIYAPHFKLYKRLNNSYLLSK